MKQLAILMVVVAVVLAGCAGAAAPAAPKPNLTTTALGTADDLAPTQAETDAAQAVLGQNGLIGIVACTLSTEYHSTVPNSAKARADALGLKVEIFDSEVKADKQISAIENFVSKGAKVIVLCVLDPQVIEAAVKEAADAGVFIVQYAGRESAVNGISVSIEDADLGCAAGEIAGDLIRQELGGQANVAILDYPDLPQVVVRADNIEKCLKLKAPDATIIGRFLGGTTENGLKSMETALQANPEIDVVASINDAGAYGAVTALEAAGKDPAGTIIVGIDAEAQAKDLIRAGGSYRGTVDTAPATTGEMVINAAVKILASATAPKNIRVPVNKITAATLK
ncbi:MAG TPA: sugar ABC transporter substrate-binding protein [Anaerolineae bacterium]|nr:sugar ABC transporter substrate-binding protein [Anaerolineae bacterium]